MLRKTNLIWENLYSLKEADIIILGVPFDSTSTEIPGTRFAPNRIREDFQVHIASFDSELGDLESIKLYDAGNVEVYHGNPQKTGEEIYASVKQLIEENPKARLITLGGEHSITPPIVRALSEKKKFQYLCYDAHLDLWDTNSGIKESHACANKRVYEILGNAEVRGYCSVDKDEYEFSKKLKKADDPIYLSVDVDVFSDKVGCPVAKHYDFETLWDEIKNRDIIGADIVEYNPMVGKDIRVAELVKRLLLKLSL
jgi:agmatinase